MATVLLREDWIPVTTSITSLATLIKDSGGVVEENVDNLTFVLQSGQTLYYSTQGPAVSGEKPIGPGLTNKPMKSKGVKSISIVGDASFSFLLEQYGEV